MNERIQKLAEQAEDWADKQNFYESEYREYFNEKFAELIVRECGQVSEDDITDGDACCTNTADRIARQIKKHFGVEE
jgi:aminoglycoside phosphotransferase